MVDLSMLHCKMPVIANPRLYRYRALIRKCTILKLLTSPNLPFFPPNPKLESWFMALDEVVGVKLLPHNFCCDSCSFIIMETQIINNNYSTDSVDHKAFSNNLLPIIPPINKDYCKSKPRTPICKKWKIKRDTLWWINTFMPILNGHDNEYP